MSYTYYGVEPYTGNIICHTGREGMRWGYSLGKLVDSTKTAVGKLNSAGQYIYDRAKSGQLGSRTIERAKLGLSDKLYNIERLRNVANNLYKSTKKYKNELAANERAKAAERNADAYNIKKLSKNYFDKDDPNYNPIRDAARTYNLRKYDISPHRLDYYNKYANLIDIASKERDSKYHTNDLYDKKRLKIAKRR